MLASNRPAIRTLVRPAIVFRSFLEDKPSPPARLPPGGEGSVSRPPPAERLAADALQGNGPDHTTPLSRSLARSASLRPRRPKISALCWPSFGATLRTAMSSPIRIARILDHAAMPHLRVGEHLRIIVDRTAGNAGLFKHGDPMRGRAGGEDGFHFGFERGAVFKTRLVRRKARVLAPFGMAERLGAAPPDRLAGRPDHQIAVLRPHALIGRVLAMARALPRRLDMIGEPLGAGPRAEADRGL